MSNRYKNADCKVNKVVNRVVSVQLPNGTDEGFDQVPQATALVGYGDPVGTTNVVNVLHTGRNAFEVANIGTQTILAPVFSTEGYNFAFDQTNGDGVEITRGITAKSPSAMVVGQEKRFFEFKCKVGDVSGVAELAIGFRKIGAYNLTFDNYTDLACINIQGGTINVETILNNGATTTTDTGETLADGVVVTVRVEVLTNGRVAFYVDGVRVLESNAFVFDAGDVLVPFVHFVNGADLSDTFYAREWRDGLLDK